MPFFVVLTYIFFAILVIHWLVSIFFVAKDPSLSKRAKVIWIIVKAFMIFYSLFVLWFWLLR